MPKWFCACTTWLNASVQKFETSYVQFLSFSHFLNALSLGQDSLKIRIVTVIMNNLSYEKSVKKITGVLENDNRAVKVCVLISLVFNLICAISGLSDPVICK